MLIRMQPSNPAAIDYRGPDLRGTGTRGSIASRLSIGLSSAAMVGGVIGTSLQYQQPFLMRGLPTDGVLLILGSVAVALSAIITAISALTRSRGRHGLLALVLSFLTVVTVIGLPMLFPDTGLGNIH